MVRKQNDGFRLHHLEKSKRGLKAVVVGAGFGGVDKWNQLVGAWPPSPHLNQYQASWPVGANVLQFLLFFIKFFGCSEPAIGKTEAVDGDCHIWDWHQIQLKYSLSINVEWKWSMGLNFHYPPRLYSETLPKNTSDPRVYFSLAKVTCLVNIKHIVKS